MVDAQPGRGDELWQEFCDIRNSMRQRFISMQRLLLEAQDSNRIRVGSSNELELKIREKWQQILHEKESRVNPEQIVKSLEELIHLQSALISQLQREKSTARTPQQQGAGNSSQPYARQEAHMVTVAPASKSISNLDVAPLHDAKTSPEPFGARAQVDSITTPGPSNGPPGFDGKSFRAFGFPAMASGESEYTGITPNNRDASPLSRISTSDLETIAPAREGEKRHFGGVEDRHLDFVSRGANIPIVEPSPAPLILPQPQNSDMESQPARQERSDLVSQSGPVFDEDDDEEDQSPLAKQLRQKKIQQAQLKSLQQKQKQKCLYCGSEVEDAEAVDADMFGKEKVHRRCWTDYQKSL